MRGIINNGRGDRGTFSIDLGFTSMKGKNLKKDHNNCSTPTLTVSWKKWFKNKDSKKLLGKLAQYVIDHVLPLRFDMDHILENNDSTFLKDKHNYHFTINIAIYNPSKNMFGIFFCFWLQLHSFVGYQHCKSLQNSVYYPPTHILVQIASFICTHI